MVLFYNQKLLNGNEVLFFAWDGGDLSWSTAKHTTKFHIVTCFKHITKKILWRHVHFRIFAFTCVYFPAVDPMEKITCLIYTVLPLSLVLFLSLLSFLLILLLLLLSSLLLLLLLPSLSLFLSLLLSLLFCLY